MTNNEMKKLGIILQQKIGEHADNMMDGFKTSIKGDLLQKKAASIINNMAIKEIQTVDEFVRIFIQYNSK